MFNIIDKLKPPDIDFMGNLYFCGAQSWPLGNINHESLADIFDRLNSADFTHKEYSNPVRILHIIKELATKSKKNTCIGDLLRVLNQTNPEFVAPLVKRTQPCWIISRDKKLQQIIIDNFSK